MQRILCLGGILTSFFSFAANASPKGGIDPKATPQGVLAVCADLCYAGPYLKDDYGIELGAAAIYGQAQAQGSDISTSFSSISISPTNAQLLGGSGIHPTEVGSWGFKLNGALRTNHDQWRICARYTWFKAVSQFANLSTNGAQIYIPTRQFLDVYTLTTDQNNIPYPHSLGSGNYTQLNTVNVFWMRPSNFSDYLEISPYFGIDASWTMRRINTLFTNFFPAPPAGQQGTFFQTYVKNQFWGVGPMAGVAADWKLGYGVSLYANGYIGLTYGATNSYTAANGYIYNNNTSVYRTIYETMSDLVYQFSPELDGQIGFAWITNCNEDVSLKLKIGYETIYYTQANRNLFDSIGYIGMPGGIGLQTLVLDAEIDF